MNDYPKYFATKEDYKNIVRDFPEWQNRVKEELNALKAINDDKVTRAPTLIDPDNPNSEWITEEISNPFSVRKQKGFKNKQEIDDLIFQVEESR